ncbi:MAG: substrate-binding domain-containing protein [Chloroflexota bacterium]
MKKSLRFILMMVALMSGACVPVKTIAPAAQQSITPEEAGVTSIPAIAITPASTAQMTMSPENQTSSNSKDIILATTTSTQDSGLLDILIPLFEQQSGYRVKVVAVGTGQALQMGADGNADVLLVHAPSSEVEFMQAGNGKDRALVMHNDFVIAGATADPAGIKGKSTIDAFKLIYQANANFVSRGDDSGTHKMELSLWKKDDLDPKGMPWYIETGQGMAATLTVASEKGAYVLTDRATFLANQKNLNLSILVEGDKALLNVYHVITVNPDKWREVNYAGALAFLKFIIAPETQQVIAKFGVDQYGQALFFADADKTDAELGLP